jgi:hypothetical protein
VYLSDSCFGLGTVSLGSPLASMTFRSSATNCWSCSAGLREEGCLEVAMAPFLERLKRRQDIGRLDIVMAAFLESLK